MVVPESNRGWRELDQPGDPLGPDAAGTGGRHGDTATRVFALLSDKVSPEISLEGEDTSMRMSQVAKELRCSYRLSLFST